MEALSPYALGTLDELLRHLEALGTGGVGTRDRAVAAGNAAVDWMERHTARALRVRTHRNTATIVGDWAASGVKVITGIASTTGVKVHDDIVGTGLPVGARVVSVDSATQITISEVTDAAAGVDVTMTVGSRPLVADGSGTFDFYVPEVPLQAVYGIQYRDGSGVLNDVNITAAYIAARITGLYRLVNDSIPAGSFNIEVECLAGWKPPSATERGDRPEWGALNRLWLRVAEVYYQEKSRHAGRITSQNLGQSSVAYDPELPRDIYRDLEPFVRRP